MLYECVACSASTYPPSPPAPASDAKRFGAATAVAAISAEAVNHPAHYGGAENTYEAIKVIEAWGLGFNLGNAAKYISRAGKKGNRLEDLRKAAWYLTREIEREQSASNS